VSLTSPAAFESSTSYNCQLTTIFTSTNAPGDGADKLLFFVRYDSGSEFRVARKDTGVAITVTYFCVGS
jgi:hypothetical protein